LGACEHNYFKFESLKTFTINNKPLNIPINDFDYDLPSDRIAKYPLPKRDESKLLFYRAGSISTHKFNEVPALLRKDDQLIFNNTRVVQARLQFKKETGSGIEIFILEPHSPTDYQLAFSAVSQVSFICLVGNAKKWKSGPLNLDFGTGVLTAENIGRQSDKFIIRFTWDNSDIHFADVLMHAGSTPIPPYLRRNSEKSDMTNYQTVYAQKDGSVAAPTAGLHFTRNVLNELSDIGAKTHEIVLHVGAGTFIPVKEENATRHSMHAEMVSIDREFLRSPVVYSRSIAVGTTSTRSIESLYWLGVKSIMTKDFSFKNLELDQWEAYELPQMIPLKEAFHELYERAVAQGVEEIAFRTRLMIVPGYRFRVINGLFTNFHQPKSTLLLLIAAATGNNWRSVYQYALENDYRFLSYGDSSLILFS